MLRSLLRSLSRLIAAVVLLALSVCALEVWLRWERLNAQSQNIGKQVSLGDVVQPSRTTWLDVVPLLELEMPVSVTETAPLRTNEYGLRAGEVALPKPPGTFRILCLGGGSLFGVGVREEETIVGHLNQLFQEHGLGHIEFLNAGCPGCGPLTNFLRLRQRLALLQADLILYSIAVEDLELDREVRGGLVLDRQEIPAYAAHPTTMETGRDQIELVRQEFATADWLAQRAGGLFGTGRSLPTKVEEVAATPPLLPFFLFHQLAQELQARSFVSILPNPWGQQPRVGQGNSLNPQALERDLHQLFADRGIESTLMIQNPAAYFVDPVERSTLFDETTGHLTRNGRILYAQTLAKSLIDFAPDLLQSRPTPHPSETVPAWQADQQQPRPRTASQTPAPRQLESPGWAEELTVPGRNSTSPSLLDFTR